MGRIRSNESVCYVHILYLHGFASSPQSKKATYFRPFFEERGAGYSIPNLNQPSFSELTLTSMLAEVARTIAAIDDDEIYLIGSSMGGLPVLHFYDSYRNGEASDVKNMALLAPALDFVKNRDAHMGDAWQEKWREAGQWGFFNYATNQEEFVHYGLVEDIMGYDSASVNVDIPMLIYHGKGDDVVDYRGSVDFAESRNTVELHLLDDDHQLLASKDTILQGILDFFEVGE